MKNSSPKLIINKNKNEIEVIILAQIAKNKIILLLIWLLLWTSCGMIIFSQFFVSHTKEIKLFMFIWFVFWIYFEFKIVYAYMWRKAGKEIIKINNKGIIIKREINGNGKEKFYAKETIKELKIVDFSSKNIALHLNTSFWAVGGETLKFESLEKPIAFAMQLSEDEAKEVYKQIKFGIR